MVARAVPGIGSAFVTTLVVAALKLTPATLVLGFDAGAVNGAAAKRTADVEAVKKSLGLVSHIDSQALASVDAGFLREDANGRGMLRPELMHGAHSPEITATALPVIGLSVILASVGDTGNVIPSLLDPRLNAVNRTMRLAFGANKPHLTNETVRFSSIAF